MFSLGLFADCVMAGTWNVDVVKIQLRRLLASYTMPRRSLFFPDRIAKENKKIFFFYILRL